MGDILNFPFKDHLPQVEEVSQSIKENRDKVVDEITNEIKDELWSLVELAGFDMTKDNLPLFVMLAEVVRAIVLSKFKIEHRFLGLANHMIDIKENGDFVVNVPNFKFDSKVKS